MLVRNYDWPTDSLTGVKCRATSVAKNLRQCVWLDIGPCNDISLWFDIGLLTIVITFTFSQLCRQFVSIWHLFAPASTSLMMRLHYYYAIIPRLLPITVIINDYPNPQGEQGHWGQGWKGGLTLQHTEHQKGHILICELKTLFRGGRSLANICKAYVVVFNVLLLNRYCDGFWRVKSFTYQF